MIHSYLCSLMIGCLLATTASADLKVLRSDDICAGQTALIPDAVVAANGDLVVTFANHADVLQGSDALFIRSTDNGKTWSDVYLKRSEEHTSELQSLLRNSYAVFRVKKKTNVTTDSKTARHIATVVKLIR